LLGDIVGAYMLVGAFLISKEKATKQAIEIGVMRLSGETDEENLGLPAVQDRLNQYWRAKVGFALLLAGFFLQGVGSWLSAS